MKSALAAMAALALCSACSVAGSAPPEHPDAGAAFNLKVGESIRVDGGALVIGFQGVTADSRCAKGEQCIWAGDATVRVWQQRAGGPKVMHELHTNSKARPSDNVQSPGLRLVRLDPIRIAGKPIAQGDYVATLARDREASGDTAER